tara:strand:+ start:399 stop:554 length:156 start_codon:yes stop_codon:yes gene_type:complete
MVVIIKMIIKMLFTEAMKKKLVVAVLDHVVASSKNKMDDKAWAIIRKQLVK